ncbi:MAG: leucyl aminopeptidase [Anaerolineae bacterium]
MNITQQTGELLHTLSDLAVLGVFADIPLPAEVSALLVPEDFTAAAGQTLLVYPRGTLAPRRLLLVGMGPSASATADSFRRAGALAVQQARSLQVAALTAGYEGEIALPPQETAQAFVEGLELGAYRFWHYRTGLTAAQTFVVSDAALVTRTENGTAVQAGIVEGQIIARGVNFARDLVNSPPSVVTPSRLGEEALALGSRLGLQITVLDKAALTKQGFGGILAVGQGSANEPRFIIMEHGQASPDKPTICFVGKGITFDSGGLSIKPADGMEKMKNDMAGSAAVLGLMQAVAELNLPLHVVGLVSSAENMPSSTAYRPGDIITTLSGKTIEVLNTDAEGRIVLSDALFYAQRYQPAAIIELSTLTGAMVIALGQVATGVMGTNEALVESIRNAGETTGERVWPLPLWPEYFELIKSEVADVKNTGGRPAGSITAGAFLASFAGDFPFAHLDIAGTAYLDKPGKSYEAPGATGVGVRLLTQYLRDLAR